MIPVLILNFKRILTEIWQMTSTHQCLLSFVSMLEIHPLLARCVLYD